MQQPIKKAAYEAKVKQPLTKKHDNDNATHNTKQLYSNQAEQCVIGALLLDNSGLNQIADCICENDFYSEEHRLLFQVITNLIKSKRPVDVITLVENLKSINKLDNAGGEAYLFELPKNTPTVANINGYANIVSEKARLRSIFEYAENIKKAALNGIIDEVKEYAKTLFTETHNNFNKNLSSSLKIITIRELLQKKFNPKELILEPLITTQSLNMIHAPRGIGKTHVSLGIAYAVASSGQFLKWKANKAHGVLFIDGEMPAAALKERVANIILTTNKEVTAPLNFLTPDVQECGMPDLSTIEGQEQVEKFITDDIKLIVIDNLSCLARSGKENEGESWLPIQDWALRQRAKGKSVLFIHHSNKAGKQRGTSRREDVLDTVILLEKPKDYSTDKGAYFKVSFEKARYLYGDEIAPFQAQLTTDEKGLQFWKINSIEESNFEKVVKLFNDGLSQKEITIELGINKSNVSRHVKNAYEQGLITRSKDD